MRFDNGRMHGHALRFLLHAHAKGDVATAHREVTLQLGHGISISIGMELERKQFSTETSVKKQRTPIGVQDIDLRRAQVRGLLRELPADRSSITGNA